MKNRLLRSGLCAIAVALLVTACTSAPTGPTGPTAQVSASATKVTLASKTGDPTEVKEKDEAHLGDTVQTDSAGRAQLDYPDGSLTRLGPDTKLTVDVLDAAEAQRTALTLDVGQSWHRVEKLVAEKAQYEVSTPVGVASVKGTAFEVDCTPAKVCTITVIEGVVEFTTEDGTVLEINPYQRLVVPNPDGGDPAVTVAPVDVVQADEWITGNIAADKITQEVPAEAVTLAGDWRMEYTYTTVSGYLTNGGRDSATIWTFGETTCAAACAFTINTLGGSTYTATLDDTGFTAMNPQVYKTLCTNPDTGEEVTDAYDYTVEAAVTRNPGSSADDVSFTGTLTWHYTFNGQPSGFCTYVATDFDEVAALTLRRI